MMNDKMNNKTSDFQLDLRELIKAIWVEKITVMAVTILFTAITVYFAISQPNIYKAEALLAPSGEESQMGGMASQLGGIAAFAGVDLSSGKGERVQLALETLVSRKFLSQFVKEHDILVPLFALQSWNALTGDITYDETTYNVKDQKWVREVHETRSVVPTAWESHKALTKLISYEKSPGSGYITLAVESQSPVLAQQWLTWLIEDINKTIKKDDLEEITRNINYLTAQLEKTPLADMQSIFYQLIEEQIKKRMLAEVQDEYVFKVIDPAVVPEDKDRPKRALICVLGAILSFLIGVSAALMKFFIRKRREN